MSAKPVTIVAFGDSITAAVTELPDPEQRWPNLLERALRARLAPRPVRVVNAGVGGNTSREGLARIEQDVTPHRPDLLLVQFGGNDATPEPARRVSLAEYTANLAAIKARADSLGACQTVWLTFPPIVDEHHAYREHFRADGGADAFIEQYRRLTREFARAQGRPLFDLDAVIRADLGAYVLPDGVHLTAAGNRAVAAALAPFLVPLCGH